MEPSTELAAAIRGIPLPANMAGRPVSRRGFPVPYFVAWCSPAGAGLAEGQGEPDFRIVDPAKMQRCLKFSLCWLCGKPLGKWRALVVGPMCLINRITAEPDSHVECAEYAAKACPFLANSRARRNTAVELVPGTVHNPMGNPRNPGVAVVFVHVERWLKRVPQGPKLAPLFKMPANEPMRLAFYADGIKTADRRQVLEALNAGAEVLKSGALVEGPEAVTELACYYAATVALVERWTDEAPS